MSKKGSSGSKPSGAGKRKQPNELQKPVSPGEVPLFDRVAAILEQARGNVVRAVNTNMVTAYWLIGREIVEAVQGGEERAEYGKQVLESLSVLLTERYGKGFSVANLKTFRQFYQAFATLGSAICYPTGGELPESEKLSPLGRELTQSQIRYPMGSEFTQAFNPLLSWSHYRALMRVENAVAHDFYER